MDLKLRVDTKLVVEKNTLELDEEIEPLSPTSQYFLSEVVTLYVLCIAELEIPVDYPSTVAFLTDIFLNKSPPRFSSIPIENKKGRKVWKKVAINVEDHITIASFPQELSTENYSEHYSNYLSKIATSKLPLNKPLWELHIINCPKGHTSAGVFVFKIHHALGDGTSIMGIVLSVFKRVDDPSLPITFLTKPPTISKNKNSVAITINKSFKLVPKFLSSIMYSLHDVGQSVRLAFFEDTKTSIRSGNTDMTRPFSSRVCSLDLPLNDVGN